MKVILANGKELPVDTSSLTEDDEYYCTQPNALVVDGMKLWDVWVATAFKNNAAMGLRNEEKLEFVTEKVFTHEPTKNELIHFLVINGLSRYSICTVEKAYALAYESEYHPDECEYFPS